MLSVAALVVAIVWAILTFLALRSNDVGMALWVYLLSLPTAIIVIVLLAVDLFL